MKILNNITTLRERRRYLRNNPTHEESVLWYKLKNSQLGYKFRRQHSIGGYILDFYCPAKKLAIEIDGLSHKGETEYDSNRTEFLNSFSVRVIRFPNTEINAELENVVEKIKAVLTTPLPPP